MIFAGMKLRAIFAFILLGTVFTAVAASGPTINVTVSTGDKVVYKSKLNADGTFSTGKLAAGSYVVQFNGSGPGFRGNQYSLLASAGKARVAADAVPGEKFGGAGVAMRINVRTGTHISGQVAGSVLVKGAGGRQPSDRGVRIINGKRYIWVRAESGSRIGRWVEEGSEAASDVTHSGVADVEQAQRIGGGRMIPGRN